MGIKKDKSSSAAAVNSLRAAASYPPGVNVGCFTFSLLSVPHVHHVCSLHLSDIMCIVFTSYPCIVNVSCVSCVYVLFVYHVYCMSTDQNINISYPSFPNRRSIYRLLLNVSDL